MKKLLILLLPSIVFAKVPNYSFYLGAGAGAGFINYYSSASTNAIIRFNGGFNLNQIISFQVGLNDYFSNTINSTRYGTYTLSGYGYDVSVLPNIPIGQNAPLNLFFRIGFGQDFMSSNLSSNGSVLDVLGLGMRYDISAHLTLDAQWIGRGLIFQQAPSNYSQNSFLINMGFYL